MLYEEGLCKLLLQDTQGAQQCWAKCEDNLFASSWGLVVIDLINNKIPEKPPKYLQIRAFFEIYMSLFIENKLFNYADNIAKYYKYLTYYNLEVPKFLARVLHAYNYDQQALNFVEISSLENYVDVEALFIAAQIYKKENNYTKAENCIESVLKNAPTYYPALELKKSLG